MQVPSDSFDAQNMVEVCVSGNDESWSEAQSFNKSYDSLPLVSWVYYDRLIFGLENVTVGLEPSNNHAVNAHHVLVNTERRSCNMNLGLGNRSTRGINVGVLTPFWGSFSRLECLTSRNNDFESNG